MNTEKISESSINETSQTKSMLMLFFSMVIIMLGFGVMIPLLPFIIERIVGKEQSGQMMGLLLAVYAIMQLIFSPMWGSVADKHGRKPLLIIATVGNSITLVAFALANNIWLLILIRGLAGFLTAAFFPAAMAYISDITTEKDRSRGMGLIGAAMGFGMILGPAIGGLFNSIQTPFFVVTGLSLLGAIGIFLILPESLTDEKKTKEVSIDIVSQFRNMVNALKSPIGFLLVFGTLVSLGLTNFEGIFSLYAAGKYGYDQRQIGLVLTMVGVISALSQGMLIGKITDLIGEVSIIKMSLFGNIIGFVLMAMAVLNNPITIYLSIAFFMISNSMMRPSLASLISKRADVPQGIAQGLNNSFMSLGRILGPLIAGFLFDINIEYPYISGTIIMSIGFILSLVFLKEITVAYTVLNEIEPINGD